nr:hypothetical protein [uncultured Flavobacterium sp.]
MQHAIDNTGKKIIPAYSGQRAVCGFCEKEVIGENVEKFTFGIGSMSIPQSVTFGKKVKPIGIGPGKTNFHLNGRKKL